MDQSSNKKDHSASNSLEQDWETLSLDCDALLLRRLALGHAKEQAAAFSSLVDENTIPPAVPLARPSLDEAVFAMIRTENRKITCHLVQKKIQKYGRIAAVIFCVFFLGFTTLFFTVDAVKLNVIKFAVQSYEEATQFNVENLFREAPASSPALTSATFRRPTYLPAGFLEMYSSLDFLSGDVRYHSDAPSPFQKNTTDPELRRNPASMFYYSCLSFHASIMLDTADCIRTAVSIHGNEGFAYSKFRGPYQGNSSVIWHDDQYIYLISGDLSESESLKVARSIA